jgi:hypothetical protein
MRHISKTAYPLALNDGVSGGDLWLCPPDLVVAFLSCFYGLRAAQTALFSRWVQRSIPDFERAVGGSARHERAS